MNEYKIVVVGGGGVGKSSLTIQFVQNHFLEEYDPTIEDSYRRQIAIDDQVALLDIMDTAGQDEYNMMRESNMRAGQGFVLVYSIIASRTFDELSDFKGQICRMKDLEQVPMVLVGNKSDLEDQRVIPAEDGATLAKSWGIPFLETSARHRINVEEIFSEVVRQIRAEFALMLGKKKNSGALSLARCCIL